VPAFNRGTDSARLDYRLMIRSPVRLLHSRDLLADVVAWLRDAGYELVEVDASWLATVHMCLVQTDDPSLELGRIGIWPSFLSDWELRAAR